MADTTARINWFPAGMRQGAADHALDIPGMPPGFGQPIIPHHLTTAARYQAGYQTYYSGDEAIRDSRQNAIYMRQHTGIRECLLRRQEATALLNWHLQPEDEDDPRQKELCVRLTQILERTKRFTEMRRGLGEAIWYGRAGVQMIYKRVKVRGEYASVIREWYPVNGDKLAFRFDDGRMDAVQGDVGIRVSSSMNAELKKRLEADYGEGKIHPTERGWAYFMDSSERKRFLLHKYLIEDGPYDDGRQADKVNGVGVRDLVYWTWLQMLDVQSWMMDFLQRSGMGIEVWKYPANNAEAKAACEAAARNRTDVSILTVPVWPGDEVGAYDVEFKEPGFAGVEAVKDLLQSYYLSQIKRLILGQNLTTESDATGLGSGVSDAHMATWSDIIRCDARGLEEDITDELVEPLKLFNAPWARDIHVRFVIDTEGDDAQNKMDAWRQAYDMGLSIKADDVRDLIGASKPDPEDEVLKSPISEDPSTSFFGGFGDGPSGSGQEPEGGPDEDGPEDGGGDEPGGPISGMGPKADQFMAKLKGKYGTGGEPSGPEKYAKFKEEDHPRDDKGRFALTMRPVFRPIGWSLYTDSHDVIHIPEGDLDFEGDPWNEETEELKPEFLDAIKPWTKKSTVEHAERDEEGGWAYGIEWHGKEPEKWTGANSLGEAIYDLVGQNYGDLDAPALKEVAKLLPGFDRKISDPEDEEEIEDFAKALYRHVRKGEGRKVRVAEPEKYRRNWNEADHPRMPAGSDQGGEFTDKQDGTGSTSPAAAPSGRKPTPVAQRGAKARPTPAYLRTPQAASPVQPEPNFILDHLNHHSEKVDRFKSGQATADEVKAAFRSTLNREASIKSDLARLSKADLAGRTIYGMTNPGASKRQLVQAAWEDMLKEHALAGVDWNEGQESHEDAIRRSVDSLTDLDVRNYATLAQKHKAEIEDLKRSHLDSTIGREGRYRFEDAESELASRDGYSMKRQAEDLRRAAADYLGPDFTPIDAKRFAAIAKDSAARRHIERGENPDVSESDMHDAWSVFNEVRNGDRSIPFSRRAAAALAEKYGRERLAPGVFETVVLGKRIALLMRHGPRGYVWVAKPIIETPKGDKLGKTFMGRRTLERLEFDLKRLENLQQPEK